jgi:hypothetical protein
MAGIELCKFTHGLGLYILRFYPSLSLGVKFEYKSPAHVYISTYVFHVNIHIFVLKYLVQIQIIQNQFKISEGGKWNSHQMPCVHSSRMVKNYRICPIKQNDFYISKSTTMDSRILCNLICCLK